VFVLNNFKSPVTVYKLDRDSLILWQNDIHYQNFNFCRSYRCNCRSALIVTMPFTVSEKCA